MPKLRAATAGDVRQIERALRLLREARGHLRKAGAGQAVKAVSRCLKSVDGARRHAQRIVWRDPNLYASAGACPHDDDPATCGNSCRHYDHGSGQRCGNCDGWED